MVRDCRPAFAYNPFSDIPGKNDLHIRIPAGFPGSGRDKLRGENHLDAIAFGGLKERPFPPVFWQTGRNNPPVSTGTEKDGFAGFSGRAWSTGKRNGARTGLI
jgi:hypothetical protein